MTDPPTAARVDPHPLPINADSGTVRIASPTAPTAAPTTMASTGTDRVRAARS